MSSPADLSSSEIELRYPRLPIEATMVSQRLTVREARGSDSNSDHTHSSLADSNYSLISGDEAAILTDEEDDEDASTRDGLDSVASFETDCEQDSVYAEEAHRAVQGTSDTFEPRFDDTDGIDTSLFEDQGSVMKAGSAATVAATAPESSQVLFSSTATAFRSTPAHSASPTSCNLRLSDRPLALGPVHSYHIIYHGRDEGLKQQIVEKIAQAVSLSVNVKKGSQRSSAFSLVPVCNFDDPKAAPQVELIPSSGLNFVVKTCNKCAENDAQCLDDVGACEADLEVFCHPRSQHILENFQCSLHFLHDTTPVIEVVTGSSIPQGHEGLSQVGAELCDDNPNGTRDFTSVFDFDSFMRLDGMELNRHIAYLEAINKKGARFNVHARRYISQLVNRIAAAVKELRSIRLNRLSADTRSLLANVSPGVAMVVFTLLVSLLLPMLLSWSSPAISAVSQASSEQQYSPVTSATVEISRPSIKSVVASSKITKVSQPVRTLSQKPKQEDAEPKLNAEKSSRLKRGMYRKARHDKTSVPQTTQEPLEQVEKVKSSLGKAITQELMVLQQNAKDLVAITGERVEKGLMRLNHESKALMRYSVEKLSKRGIKVNKRDRRELKKLKCEMRVTVEVLRRATREELRQSMAQLRNNLQSARILARQAMKDAQKLFKDTRVTAHAARRQAFSSMNVAKLRQLLAQQHTWYKSRRLGRARAASRRLVNRVAGREVYSTGLDYE